MTTPTRSSVVALIDQSLADVLTLMQQFEDTGMMDQMREDYLRLYEIYEGLQTQREALQDLP